MASLAVLYRRAKKLFFFLIIFYLVRAYCLRKKKGGSGDKRLMGPPERKRITDGSEQKSNEKSKVSNSTKEEKEKENDKIEEERKVEKPNSLENTETAVYEDSRKENNIITEVIGNNNTSSSISEKFKDPKSLDMDKTEIVNGIIEENEIRNRDIVVNNVEVIPSTNDIEDIKIKTNDVIEPTKEIKELNTNIMNPSMEEKALNDIVNNLNETEIQPEVVEDEYQPKELINNIKENIEKPEELVEIVENIIIPTKDVNSIVENPEKVDVIINDSNDSLKESSGVIEVVNEDVVEPEPAAVTEELVEEIIKLPESPIGTFEESTEAPQVIDDATEEIIELSTTKEQISEKDPQSLELLISEIEKVVDESGSEMSETKESETKKVVNAADIVGHEEIIYEGDVDDDDDGEWVDEDDDGEWVDEDDDDGEWVDEDDEEIEETKPEKRQSLILDMENAKKRLSLNLNPINSPIETVKRRSLHLNTPLESFKNSMTPLSATSTNFALPTPAPSPVPSPTPEDNKPKVLPDAILDRIFRETDPQTMWVLRNTSLKTRAIVDNILKETFEQFDLSMDPLYFDVTSKENLGLVLNSLDLSPFALAMLLHEILKLDSQHIGYAFGQMFRVPSKVDVEYLTDIIVDTLNILKEKEDVDIANVMLGLQHYYCFNHSELEFYQLFDLIEMTPEEVARYIQNHYHFILSKSLPPLLTALEVDEVYVAEMCKAYANEDMDAFARFISKVPVNLVRTSIHPGDVQGERVVVVNENGEDVIVVLNNEERPHGKTPANENEWVEDDNEEVDEEENMIIVENNESYSIMVGRILRFLNMTTKDVASFLKYLPEYCSYDEDEILEGLNWNKEQIDEMRQIMKEEQDKIARKMKELSKLIIQRRLSISSGLGSPVSGSSSPIGRSPSTSSAPRYL